MARSAPVSFALVGCGKIAKKHAAALRSLPAARIAAVCDSRIAAAEALGKELGVPAYASVEDMVQGTPFDAGCVLGAPRTDWRSLDLGAVTGVTRVNGVEVARGRGADVMGHPLEALAWLANQRSRRGVGLLAGEFVFTGSVVATQWLAPGDHVAMTLDGLGEIEADFSA